MDELQRCEHCQNRNELWQLEKLTPKKCSILYEDEVYHICDFCIEMIEGEGEGEEEIQYWNEWVKKRRLSKNSNE